ncbi:hypothetical protein [Arsenicibacter rosenii]|uniref:Gliding motility lipoprotein GldD n=1 Tax=Arsenicibacter rosenii TaxID=1750698 RepID=A0A1S2VD54_9BACT|nr:hypothetical protein [Arsenicibacter rosenii]OIN56619.1 hypothetical protein BLX24_23600 [Arsenicibacter rosenii]
MKRGVLFLLMSCVAVLSCQTDAPVAPSITTGPKRDWVTIDLNIDYTIQFPPAAYQGKGYSLRSAGSFGDSPTRINRTDQQTVLSAAFCNPNAYPCLLMQYDQTLPSPAPASLPYLNAKGETKALNNTIAFTNAGKQIGLLYYASDPNTSLRPYTGHLYLRASASGQFQYAGLASFSEATKDELFDILSTLSPK